jgi:hypothetical protein
MCKNLLEKAIITQAIPWVSQTDASLDLRKL